MNSKIILDHDDLNELADLIAANAIENIADQIKGWQLPSTMPVDQKAQIKIIFNDMAHAFGAGALDRRKGLAKDSKAFSLMQFIRSKFRVTA